jgi:predicted Fe-S protein YdhL (DUF1289 family)
METSWGCGAKRNRKVSPDWLATMRPLLLLLQAATALNTGGVPSTPCTRICRYNADVFNGHVCIGCYRESFEIAQWGSMSNGERSYALLDAADRIDTDDGLEGAVSKKELLRQAKFWGDLEGEEERTNYETRAWSIPYPLT